MKVTVNFIGVPSLYINNRKIFLSQKKITTLMFYLFFEKEVLRSRISSLFWEDKNEQQAFANLRNAIYLLKKALPESILVIDRSVIKLSSDVIVCSDLDKLASLETCSLTMVKKLGGEFLSGIGYLGDEFNHWLESRRQEHVEHYICKLNERITIKQQEQHYDDVIQCLKLLIEQDNFDEHHYLRLMQVYAEIGHMAKAIKVYSNLVKILADELNTQPSLAVSKFYQQLLDHQSDHEVESYSEQEGRYGFWGRTTEADKLLAAIRNTKVNHNSYIMLSGEAGIGKRFFLNHLISKISAQKPFYCRAYEISEKYPYSSWNGFFTELSCLLPTLKSIDPLKLLILKTYFPSLAIDYRWPSNTNFSPLLQSYSPIQLGELLAEVMNVITHSQRRLIILENFQWFDQTSLVMLQSFLAATSNLIIIALYETTSGEYAFSLENFINFTDKVCQIELLPFSYEETITFCESSLKRLLTEQEKQQIYEETGGVPLYVIEILDLLREGKPITLMSEKVAGIIKHRLQTLTTNQYRILESLSVFTSEVFYADFIQLFNQLEEVNKKDLSIVDDLDYLCKKNFISEHISNANNLKLKFTHDRIKHYVYTQMSEVKKRILHEHAANLLQCLAMRKVWDNALENETIYHYKKMANDTAVLNFQLMRLRRHVIINHELFPVIEDSELLLYGLPFSTRSMTEQRLQQSEQILCAIKSQGIADVNLQQTTAYYQEINGSYNIYFGNYQDGEYAVRQALNYALRTQQRDMVMRCLIHLAFIGIQTENPPFISEPVNQLCSIAEKENNDLMMAIGLRFLGINKQIMGNVNEAEQFFLQSKEKLERLAKSGQYYTLNILAVENYIGELYHRKGAFSQANDYFETCLAQCYEKNLFWGRALFHSNLAYVALSQHHYDYAEQQVNEAIRLFETTPSGRKSSIAYSIKAFLEAQKGNKTSALNYLVLGDELCQPIQKKSWMALQLWVKAQLKMMPIFNQEIALHSLSQDANVYQCMANTLFRAIHFDEKILS